MIYRLLYTNLTYLSLISFTFTAYTNWESYSEEIIKNYSVNNKLTIDTK